MFTLSNVSEFVWFNSVIKFHHVILTELYCNSIHHLFYVPSKRQHPIDLLCPCMFLPCELNRGNCGHCGAFQGEILTGIFWINQMIFLVSTKILNVKEFAKFLACGAYILRSNFMLLNTYMYSRLLFLRQHILISIYRSQYIYTEYTYAWENESNRKIAKINRPISWQNKIASN